MTNLVPRLASNNALLKLTSLTSILLMTLHISDDIRRNISPPGADNIGAVAIFVVWLVGTLLLAERRWGYAIMLLGGIFAAAMPFLHMPGTSYPAIATSSSGGWFFVWNLIAVGTSGVFSIILALRAFWLHSSSRTT